MESAVVLYVGMVLVQFAQVGLMIVGKKAIANGMSSISFVFYSNSLASLILFLPSLFIFLHTNRSSNRPQLSFSILCGFVLLGIFGFLANITGYTGISYSSATLATTMLNLIPGFTFILAILFRMEIVDCGSSITHAKTIGTVVSIVGAIIVTLYKGPTILTAPLHSIIPHHHLMAQTSNWVIGGVFLAIDCVFSSMFVIAQALILKKYSAVFIVIFSYCFVVAILSGLVSLIIKADPSTFSLQPTMRLLSVVYSGVFGSAFQVTVQAWCVRKKGPLFVAMFQPVGILISTAIGVVFLGDGFYLGGLVGSIVICIGFYAVMWGKAKEEKTTETIAGSSSMLNSEKGSLLQDDVEEHNAPPLP